MIVPRHVLGMRRHVPASDKLNIACIGISGMGANDVQSVSTENIVALCDVDWKYAAETFNKYPRAKKYRDFRKMLDEEDSNVDAVTVSTPDHTHAVAAITVMKAGKHVYCQKPLAHDVAEVRLMRVTAARQRAVTQMGIQLHAGHEIKLLVEIIKAGLIGKVRRVDLWSGKDWGGGTRPTDRPSVPETLDWDLWLGPAPFRPYHPTYLPGNWRRWWDFGTGTLGDMACHIMDPAWWALDLDYLTTIEATPGEFNEETYPQATIVRWEFGARNDRPPVTVTWYDGANRPPRPAELEPERQLPDQGGLYYGDNGVILMPHMSSPRLIPESKMKEFKLPRPSLPRGVDHYQEWIKACKGGPKPLADFDYSGPLSEAVLLGNIAARAKTKLDWSGQYFEIRNAPDAAKYLRREYRQGWKL